MAFSFQAVVRRPGFVSITAVKMKTVDEFYRDQGEADREWKAKGHAGVGRVCCEDSLYLLFTEGVTFGKRVQMGGKDAPPQEEFRKALLAAVERVYEMEDAAK